MRSAILATTALCACATGDVVVGDWQIAVDEAGMTVAHATAPGRLEHLVWHAGDASADVEMSFGAFRWRDEAVVTGPAGVPGRVIQRDAQAIVEVLADGKPTGTVAIAARADGSLALRFEPLAASWVGLSFDCAPDEHVLGLGSHAFDVEHTGEAFSLWTSEPGIGKVDSEVPAEDWFLTGTRHATSLPVPFVLRAGEGQGIELETTGRVDVDLCASDPGRMRLGAWDRALGVRVFPGPTALDAVRSFSRAQGSAPLAPAWAFAPWVDAIRGRARVEAVAARLRAFDAPVSVIWTEDFKGAEQTAAGYHLTGEWFVDEALYPDSAGLAAALEAQGFQWFAYFSPFVFEGTATYADALAADVVLLDAAGDPLLFPGATFAPTSMVDLSVPEGRAWAAKWMRAALAGGFDGWMADYAEWLPLDAAPRSGESARTAHNRWPLWWQETNAAAIGDADATFFARSGWRGTAGVAPIVWAGDQRTSFDADDGLPTVVPLGLGAAASGIPVFTHDVAGYQSVGNAPSDKDLWFRWCALGAFSPILRTHHGAFDTENWQFDSDDETTNFFAAIGREHTRLFPYRYGLAAQAAADGTPMILPLAFLFADQPWDRMDAWMLGPSLLVAPVMTAGATGREVALPAGRWFDAETSAEVTSGWFAAGPWQIPVFVAEGSVIPRFVVSPDTLLAESDPALVGLTDVDPAREVRVYGAGGAFTEADGTRYHVEGTPTTRETATSTFVAGVVEVGGARVRIDGPVERAYTVVVVP